MTREEAIEQLQICKDLIKQDGQDYLDERDYPLLDIAIETLSAGERIEMSEWIVGGKPKKPGRYLVTLDNYVGTARYVKLLYYGKPHGHNKICWYATDNEWGDIPYDDEVIIAWKPLPTPYGERIEKRMEAPTVYLLNKERYRGCDTCKNNGLEWYEEPCDSCTFGGKNNHYERETRREE